MYVPEERKSADAWSDARQGSSTVATAPGTGFRGVMRKDAKKIFYRFFLILNDI